MSNKVPVGTGEFRLAMQIAKSYEKTTTEGDIKKYIAGIASGTGIDRDSERMADTAIEAFKKAIDDGVVLPDGKWSLIPLRSGHRREWDDVLGWVTKAEIDNDQNLWIEAELDDTSVATDLYRKLTQGEKPGRPVQLGFSVAGRVLAADFEWNADLNKKVRVFKDVRLTEISVVGSPAYPTAYVEALQKSVPWEELPPSGIITKENESMADDVTKTEEVSINKESETSENDAEKAKRTIRESYSSTSQTETVIDDGNTDNSGDSQNSGDTFMLSQKETPNSEEVSKTDATDPKNEGDVVSLIQGLVSEVASLRQALSAKQEESAQVTEETKSEKVEEPSDEIEKSGSPSADAINKAIRDAIAELKLGELTTELQALKSVVNEIASSEVDKSIAVRKQKQEDEEDPLEKFQREVPELMKSNVSPIAAAVKFGYRGKQ